MVDSGDSLRNLEGPPSWLKLNYFVA